MRRKFGMVGHLRSQRIIVGEPGLGLSGGLFIGHGKAAGSPATTQNVEGVPS